MTKIWKHRRVIGLILALIMMFQIEFPVGVTAASDSGSNAEFVSGTPADQDEEEDSGDAGEETTPIIEDAAQGDDSEISAGSEEEGGTEEPGTSEEGKDGAEEPGTSQEENGETDKPETSEGVECGTDKPETSGEGEGGAEEPETENTGNVDTTPVISEDTAALLAEFIEMLATLPTADGSLNQEEYDQVVAAYNKYSAAHTAFMTDNGDGSFDFDEYLLSTYEGMVENFYALLATPMTTDEPMGADISEHDGLKGVAVNGVTKGNIVKTAAENIEVHLFNYGAAINPSYVWDDKTEDKTDWKTAEDTSNVIHFGASTTYKDTSLDGAPGSIISALPIMSNSLKNGYPYVDSVNLSTYTTFPKDSTLTEDQKANINVRSGSLKYLFDKDSDFVDSNGNSFEGVQYDPVKGEFKGDTNGIDTSFVNTDKSKYQSQHYEVKNDGEGTGLFKDEDGYLVFDSSDNFAWYNKDTQKFELYDFALRPRGGGEGNRARGHFLPFNSDLSNAVQVSDDNGILSTIATRGELDQNTNKYTWSVSSDQKDNAEKAGLYYGLSDGAFALNSVEKDYFRNNVWALPDPKGNRAEMADYWYGMSVEFDFYMPAGGQVDGKDMIFEFLGDDDVWVYLDGRLVLDMGISDGKTIGTINFASGEVNTDNPIYYTNLSGEKQTVTNLKQCFIENGTIVTNSEGNPITEFNGNTFANYTKHTLKFFYMDRGGGSCNCRLKFNIPTLPPNSLTVTKELTSEASTEVKEYIEASVPYKFRVLKVDDAGNATDELFIPGNTPYKIMEGGVQIGTGTTNADTGEFTIKANQSALFEKMLEIGAGETKYIVEEILDSDIKGQYAGVEYVINSAGGDATVGDDATSFTSYQSGVVDAALDGQQVVVFKNRVDTAILSTLKITKQVEAGSNLPTDRIFRMQVTLGGKLLPAGTGYKVGATEYKVGADGCVSIKANETAEILAGILSGTEYQVQELDTETYKYRTTYEGTETIGGKDPSKLTFENPSQAADGTITLNSSVEIVVHNATYDFAGEIPITKQYLGNTATKAFQFDIAQVKEDGTPLEGASQLPGTSITVKDADETSGKIVVGYDKTTEDGSYYYKITEKSVDEDRKTLLYDGSSYIVEMKVSDDTAAVESIKRNGENYSGNSVKFVNRKMIPVTINKTVSGNLGDQSKAFPFSLSITVDGKNYTKQLDYLRNNAYGMISSSNDSYAFNLAHGQSIQIFLPYGCNYTLSENMEAEWKYDSTTFVVDEGEPEVKNSTSDVSVSKENLTEAQNISVTNHKEEIPDTGISLDSMPYILVLALAVIGVAIFIIFKRKRRDDD